MFLSKHQINISIVFLAKLKFKNHFSYSHLIKTLIVIVRTLNPEFIHFKSRLYFSWSNVRTFQEDDEEGTSLLNTTPTTTYEEEERRRDGQYDNCKERREYEKR